MTPSEVMHARDLGQAAVVELESLLAGGVHGGGDPFILWVVLGNRLYCIIKYCLVRWPSLL
jgi:hypothetical protein